MTDVTDHRKAGVDSATIMVVDPDILARMVIADYLRECGYHVVEGLSADDVFIALGAGVKIDIIFADVHLPGAIDGFSLARRIREAYPEIGVILTAGTASAAQKASDLCDDGPLNKPYHPHDVTKRINILREQRRISQIRSSQGDGASEEPQAPTRPIDLSRRDIMQSKTSHPAPPATRP